MQFRHSREIITYSIVDFKLATYNVRINSKNKNFNQSSVTTKVHPHLHMNILPQKKLIENRQAQHVAIDIKRAGSNE